jgi:hypothetical protein
MMDVWMGWLQAYIQKMSAKSEAHLAQAASYNSKGK